MVTLQTLGTLSAHGSDGRELESISRSPKRVAVLVYLLVARPQVFHRRDVLAALFWPELDHVRARRDMRQILFMLRRDLGPEAIVSRGGDEVGVSSDGVACDATTFQTLLDEGRTRDAVDLYQGDFLQGFHLPGCPGFDNWLDTTRASLHARMKQGVRELIVEDKGHNRNAEAVRWTERLVQIDPVDEESARCLIDLLHAQGNRAVALREYERLKSVLGQELGVSPSPETLRLIESIRSNTAGDAGAAPDNDSPGKDAAKVPRGDTDRESDSTVGVEPSTPDLAMSSKRPWHRRLVKAGAAMVGIVALGTVGWSVSRGVASDISAGGSVDNPTVAILPYEDLSEESEAHYAPALTDDLMSRVSAIRALTTISLEAVLRELAGETPPTVAAARVAADFFYSATVERLGDSVRVVAQLAKASGGAPVWANTFHGALDEIFRWHAQVAEQIAGELESPITAAEHARIATVPTANLTAWDHLQRARLLLGPSGNIRATEKAHLVEQQVRRAIELDPNIGQAHAILADVYDAHYWHSLGSAYRDSALAELERAVELSPEDPWVLASASRVLANYGWDPQRALEFALHALELDANTQGVIGHIGSVYGGQFGYDRQWPWIQMQARVDPDRYRDARIFAHMWWILGDYERSETWLRSALALRPEMLGAYWRLVELQLSQNKVEGAKRALRHPTIHGLPRLDLVAGLVALFDEDYKEAIIQLEAAMVADPPTQYLGGSQIITPLHLGFAYWKTGARVRARELFEQSKEIIEEIHRPGDRLGTYQLARIEAITGNTDGANRLLEAAVEAGWPFAYTHMGPVDPLLENLRGHPTFERIMARARANLDRQREAIEDMVLPPTMQEFDEMIRQAREELLPLLASTAPQSR